MKKIVYLFCCISFLFIISSCSSSEQTTQTETPKSDSVYVFDEVPEPEPENFPEPDVTVPSTPATYFIVQIGAFTTMDKAESFAEMSRRTLNREVVVIYSNQVNLFVVQLSTLFPQRSEAETVRNDLWKNKDFKDAWILTVTK